MKDIVTGLGGTDGSPGSISPGELSEMKAVLDADRSKMESHFSEGHNRKSGEMVTPMSTSTVTASSRTVIDVPSDDVSEVTDVPSDGEEEDEESEDVMSEIAAMKIAIQEKLVETDSATNVEEFPTLTEDNDNDNTVIT